MTWLTRLLREPLLHFLLIGALIFLAWSRFGAMPVPDDAEIVVTPQRIERLAALFAEAWQRPPTEEELRGLVAGDIREEIYYREALALGLDRDDVVIRRRMRQKMEFLIDATAGAIAPGEEELAAWYAEHREAFREPMRLDFEQIYLGQRADPETVAALRARLAGGADPAALGEPTLLPPAMNAALAAAVDGVFGPGFFARLEGLPTGRWQGPVESAYGLHLVRIRARREGAVPPLEQVREDVLRRWRMEKAAELRDRDYAERRRKYRVRIEWPPEAVGD